MWSPVSHKPDNPHTQVWVSQPQIRWCSKEHKVLFWTQYIISKTARDLVSPNQISEGAVQGWTRTISSPLQHRVVLIGFALQHPGHLMVTETMITAMYWTEGMSHPDLGQRLKSMSSKLEPPRLEEQTWWWIMCGLDQTTHSKNKNSLI